MYYRAEEMDIMSTGGFFYLHGKGVFKQTVDMDIMSTGGFFYLHEKGVFKHTVGNKVSALARLTLYENLFIGQGCPYKRNLRI